MQGDLVDLFSSVGEGGETRTPSSIAVTSYNNKLIASFSPLSFPRPFDMFTRPENNAGWSSRIRTRSVTFLSFILVHIRLFIFGAYNVM